MTRLSVIFFLCILIGTSACKETRIHELPELESVFASYGITDACFIIRDHTHESVSFYNREKCLRRTSPASTFKVFNSLVALETGKAPDDQLVIPWDSVFRRHEEWNKSMNLREAFKVSNVPYFQELARRIGRDNMQHYLDTVQYGNKRIGDAIDQFWLNDTLTISADEQAGFLKRLYFDQLPFSERSQRIVRSMMLREQTPEYKLYYKTGTYVNADSTVYRIIGFMEKIVTVQEHENSMNKSGIRNYPFFFAQDFTVATSDSSHNWFDVRLEVLHTILNKLVLQ